MSDELLATSAQVFAELQLPDPPFVYTVGLADSHLDLLDGHFSAEGEPQLLAETAWRQGRVLLHAEGGAGKSTIARRLLRDTSRAGHFAAIVDLREWSPDLLEEWDELRGDAAARAELLLTRLGRPSFGEEQLDALGDAPALLVLDGLNETPGPTASSLLEVAEGIAARHPQAGVLVTDRLLRRTLPSRRWRLAGITDVTAPSQTDAATQPIVRANAFFLSLTLRDDVPAGPGTEVLDYYLARHVQLDDGQLRAAADAAANAYHTWRSRTFAWQDFAKRAGSTTFERLQASGLIKVQGEQAIFRHHLFHDDLAARWLAATSPANWTASTFAALTFEANSFDVLALTLARIDEQQRADQFVLSVYDYNYYGTAYALAEATQLGHAAVDNDTRVAIIAMLAERRFDTMRPTVDQVEDALRLFDDEIARILRTASSVAELIARVDEITIQDSHISRWKKLFVAVPGQAAAADAIAALLGDDPLLGWTAANVLRRTVLDPGQLRAVHAALANDERPVVRWRAAHALGHQQELESVEALLRATEDEDSLVRYGATRSLVDLAHAHSSLRSQILKALENEAPRLVADPKPAVELERSLQRVDANQEWINAVAPLVEALWANAPTLERREHWRVVAREIGRVANPAAT
jgi:hypothetical protein